jgi:hypothetical protein
LSTCRRRKPASCNEYDDCNSLSADYDYGIATMDEYSANTDRHAAIRDLAQVKSGTSDDQCATANSLM